jgi:N-acetylneuraminic acid mutarotase
MNRTTFVVAGLVAVLSLTLMGCPKSTISPEAEGNWVYSGEFSGLPRSNAVAFVINNTAYIGTGYNNHAEKTRLNDFWKYTVDSGWEQVADFPGVARSNAVAFAIDNYGYVGTGTDGVNMFNDFYAYNANTNQWNAKANFIGTPRYDAVGFSVQGKGYIATGFNNYWLNDNYVYDPSNDTWQTTISYEGDKRRSAVAFVHDDKAYIVTGTNSAGLVKDCWMFDPSQSKQWTRLKNIDNTVNTNYTDIARENAVVFVLNDKAYLTTGDVSPAFNLKTWMYDFSNDTWTRRTSYERPGRYNALTFTINGRSFVCCGNNGNEALDDFDEYQPDKQYNPND